MTTSTTNERDQMLIKLMDDYELFYNEITKSVNGNEKMNNQINNQQFLEIFNHLSNEETFTDYILLESLFTSFYVYSIFNNIDEDIYSKTKETSYFANLFEIKYEANYLRISKLAMFANEIYNGIRKILVEKRNIKDEEIQKYIKTKIFNIANCNENEFENFNDCENI